MIIYVNWHFITALYEIMTKYYGDSENKLNITESLVSILLWPYIILW
jgi:hypothetical protein